MEFVKPSDVTVEQSDNLLKVSTKSDSTAMSGTTRSLLFNMVTGVSKGWEKKLTLVGVGYRAKADKLKPELAVGYSHLLTLKYLIQQLKHPLKQRLLFLELINKKLDKSPLIYDLCDHQSHIKAKVLNIQMNKLLRKRLRRNNEINN